MKKITLDKNYAKQLGRTLVSGNSLKLILSGTGCEFTFTGKKLQISLGCGSDCISHENASAYFPRVAVLVNGRFAVKKTIESLCETFTVFESGTAESVNVKIIKLSESAFGIAEVFPLEIQDGEEISPVPGKSLRIEFIGDSITCGYGVDNSDPESEFSTATENVMKSFSYRTALLLDAEYSMFSASGYGIISGYTDNGARNAPEIIPPFYESFGYSRFSADRDTMPQDIPWDFSRYTPDAIVINLGTNDHSFCKQNAERTREFEDSYLDFLGTVRRLNPDAVIFCVLGIMETDLFPQVENAVHRFGDSRVFAFGFQRQDGSLGYSVNWHPSEDTYALAAERLAEFMKKSLQMKFEE